MKSRKGLGFWLAACIAATATCGEKDEPVLNCGEEGRIGPPGCAAGQLCASGKCKPCLSSEVCGNSIDDDCDGVIDQGCGAAGKDAAGDGPDA